MLKASVQVSQLPRHSGLLLLCRGVTVSLCCPGPAATGSPNQPRSIYSGTGLITTASSSKDSSKRMAPARVAELIGKAAYYKVDECWIAKHPVLLLGEPLFATKGQQ